VWTGLALGLAAGLAFGLAGFMVAQAGLRTQLVAVGAAGLCAGLLLVSHRERYLLAVLILSFQFPIYKSFGPLNLDVEGGAPALTLSTSQLLLFGLFVFWLLRGTAMQDLRRPGQVAAIALPGLAVLLVLPSLALAPDGYLAVAQLNRLAWTYALYVYVVLAVRTRGDLVTALAALLGLGLMQSVLVALQWRTHSFLGLDALWGLSVAPRLVDEGEVFRPTGTLIHPVFLGAVMAMIALVALALAIGWRRDGWRVGLLGVASAALAAMVLAQSRAGLMALAVAAGVLTLAYVRRGRLDGRVVAVGAVTLALAAVLFQWPSIENVATNLGTEEFWWEMEARMQLNGYALRMIGDAPLFGVGLNNFEAALERYDTSDIVYRNNPVHNLFLLVWTETGLLGLGGLLAAFGLVAARARQASRADDPLFQAVGLATLAVLLFFLVEEMTVFSLRQEAPGLSFWLLAGLAVASARLAEEGAHG
jgi:O-antigen ligase